jgi:hypothetical protein
MDEETVLSRRFQYYLLKLKITTLVLLSPSVVDGLSYYKHIQK